MFKKDVYRTFEKKLGYRFRKKSLLKEAMAHPSYRHETGDVDYDNQRLEFLGDAVLSFLTGAELYERFNEHDEGMLTTLRSQLTRDSKLAEVARDLDVGAYLKVGRGEESSGGRKRASSLSDAFEAILGAIYLGGGVRAAKAFLKKHLFSRLECSEDSGIWLDNPKGELQERCQAIWRTNPVYRVIHRDGPAHAFIYTVEVRSGDGSTARGSGKSKQSAEKSAAEKMLKLLNSGKHGK